MAVLQTVTFCSAVFIIARKNSTWLESFFALLKARASKGLYIKLLGRHKFFKKI